MCLVICCCHWRLSHQTSWQRFKHGALADCDWFFTGIGSWQFRQQSSSALVYQVQGQRCYALAKSQLELALVQLFPLDSTAASCAAVTTSRNWSRDDWQGCRSTLSCQQVSVDGSQSFRLTSTATCGQR